MVKNVQKASKHSVTELEGRTLAALDMPNIKLPRVGQITYTGNVGEQWTNYSYNDFADKLIKDNPSVEFNQQTVDECFRCAVEKVSSITRSGGRTREHAYQLQKMTARV